MGLAGDQSDAAIIQAAFNACGGQYMYSPIGIEFAGNWWSHGRIVGHQGMVIDIVLLAGRKTGAGKQATMVTANMLAAACSLRRP